MIAISNADRIVFPEIQRTKGDVVNYYERLAERALPHVVGRPLSLRRFPKGLSGPGFFQKNVPAHYPDSFGHFKVPRSAAAGKKHPKKTAGDREVTVYPVLRQADQFAYLANQGVLELHVPTTRVSDPGRPDRVVIDLDPPSGATALVQRAAQITRDLLGHFGLESVPIATGSKGYHVVGAIVPSVTSEALAVALQQIGALLAAKHPNELTTQFRIAMRGQRVYIDWLRNRANATVIAPYSLRARPRASVATPLAWPEIEHVAPDAFTIADVSQLLDRPDTLAELAKKPSDGEQFVSAVKAAFETSGLVLEPFDRFRS